MKSLSQSTSHRKPVGGIRSVLLSTIDNVAEVEFSAGGVLCTSLKFVDDNAVVECALLDEKSTFEEEISPEGGVVAVHHRLVLISERDPVDGWLETELWRGGIHKGLCAVVTLNNGRKLLVGYSERFGAEQPLRVVAIKNSSQQRRVDMPTVTLTLENFDTSTAAVIITE